MPIGSMNPQETIQYVNNPLQSPQLQESSAQHSSMKSYIQANKENDGGGDQYIQPLMSQSRLRELVREVDPTLQLHEDVQKMLLRMADDFVNTTLTAAGASAKKRRASTVELRDIQLQLERCWNMWIPGFGNVELRPTGTETHQRRRLLTRKIINN